MNYYKVWITAMGYKGEEPLSYSSKSNLQKGSIVTAPFRDRLTLGVIESKTQKPDFKVKPIKESTGTSLPAPLIDLFKWSLKYYPGAPSSHLQLLLPSIIMKSETKSTELAKDNTKDLDLPPKLTREQTLSIDKINSSPNTTVLLHGDTGTGKTRVYVELIKDSLEKGLSAIVLTPEIGLTSQLVHLLDIQFPGKVITMHSRLSPKDRMNNWLRILSSSDPVVVVGPRSALFSPISKLGIIVIDESHESAYKQEQSPNYQATRVAAKLAQIHKAKLIMGTATPPISDYYLLSSKGSLVVRMKEAAVNQGVKPHKYDIKIIDLSDRDKFNRSHWLSDELIKSVKKSLGDSEQSLIFLNRRGTALLVLCEKCGWRAICPNCDTSLTYHSDTHDMLCHSCNYRSKIPLECPSCKNKDIVFKGAGTKLITEELTKLFPLAKISRFDKDNHKGERIGENYKDLVSGEIDIIVGTQITTKGFDLPKLSTVGVVLADSSLYFPDYTAEEKTFQTLTQVIGRVRRGHRDGRVIIQTYNPDGVAIKAAVDNNYKAFYDEQLIERKSFNFPPFRYLLVLGCRNSNRDKAITSCEKLIKSLKSLDLPIEINGPSPAFNEKQANKYNWQIIVKSKERAALLDVIKAVPAKWSYDIDPTSLL